MLTVSTYLLLLFRTETIQRTDCLGAVIRRKLTNATNGQPDNTNQQMPNYLKLDTEQRPPSSNEGQGCRAQTGTHTSWPAMRNEIPQRLVSSQAAADRSQLTGRLTGGLLPGAPPSLRQHEPPLLSWEPVLCACLAQSCSWGIRLTVSYSLPQGK